MENCLALIVAAGRGSRMADGNSDDNAPKQYRKLGNSNVLQTAIDAFTNHEDIANVLVVIHEEDEIFYRGSVRDHPKLYAPVIGGSTRQNSIYNGLLAADELQKWDKVLIHDAARVFVSDQTIKSVIDQIEIDQGAVPACPVADTLKKIDHRLNVTNTVTREKLYAAQTPQGFVFEEILDCHRRAQICENDQFTDDASMFEAAGKAIKIVPSPSSNFKITTVEDLEHARRIVAATMPTTTRDNDMKHADIRVGNGYDVHRFTTGDAVILGGVSIKFDRKLSGHSDADVVLHALTDALLGTVGKGDIGSHFPPSDEKWKGADSQQFLAAALEIVEANGGKITNLDVTIICEAPKIGPHRDLIRKNISTIANVDLSRVSIKATTNEKMGFLGREEGIAAIANASVSFGMMD